MRELGKEKIPASVAKIVGEQKRDKGIEKKPESSEEEEEIIVSKLVVGYEKNRKNFKNLEKTKDIKAQIELSEKIASETPIRGVRSSERILNGVIKEFELNPERYDPNLGLVLQSVINRMAEYADKKYMGKPEKNNFKISLDTYRLEKPLDFLSHTNRNNVELVILGNVGKYLAFEMGGGRTTVVGDTGKETAKNKKDGNVLIIGNVESFGERSKDKGTVWQVAPRKEKQEK